MSAEKMPNDGFVLSALSASAISDWIDKKQHSISPGSVASEFEMAAYG